MIRISWTSFVLVIGLFHRVIFSPMIPSLIGGNDVFVHLIKSLTVLFVCFLNILRFLFLYQFVKEFFLFCNDRFFFCADKPVGLEHIFLFNSEERINIYSSKLGNGHFFLDALLYLYLPYGFSHKLLRFFN